MSSSKTRRKKYVYLRNLIEHNEERAKQKLNLIFILLLWTIEKEFSQLLHRRFGPVERYVLLLFIAGLLCRWLLSFTISPSAAVDPKWHFTDSIFLNSFFYSIKNKFLQRMDLAARRAIIVSGLELKHTAHFSSFPSWLIVSYQHKRRNVTKGRAKGESWKYFAYHFWLAYTTERHSEGP